MFLPAELRPGGAPVQAAGDHQVKDEPEIAVESDGDALADAAQFADGAAFGVAQRRNRRAQQKRCAKAHAFEALADNARLQRDDVCRDVGQFGHVNTMQ